MCLSRSPNGHTLLNTWNNFLHLRAKPTFCHARLIHLIHRPMSPFSSSWWLTDCAVGIYCQLHSKYTPRNNQIEMTNCSGWTPLIAVHLGCMCKNRPVNAFQTIWVLLGLILVELVCISPFQTLSEILKVHSCFENSADAWYCGWKSNFMFGWSLFIKVTN